jgi:hypothetical protein
MDTYLEQPRYTRLSRMVRHNVHMAGHEMKNVITACFLVGVVACTSCSTLRQTPQEREIEAELQSIVLPEADFRLADIHCVVAFLNGSMVGGMDERKPHIVLLLPHGKTTDLITLHMRHASILEVVAAVAKLTDSKFYIKGNHPYLEPRNPRRVESFEMEQDPFE